MIEGWTFNYEFHVVDPENVVLASGKYFTEDNWLSPGYPNCDWLFFPGRGRGADLPLARYVQRYVAGFRTFPRIPEPE